MVTLNNLITDLTSIGNNHDQVETVTNGTLAEFSLNKDDRFPVLHFSPGVTTASGKEIIYSVDILVADIAQDNGDDRDEILSDTNQILLDVIREFRLPATTISRYKYTINDDIALEPFIDDNVDRCTGWLATLEIKVPFDECASDSPFGVIPPDSCADASVTNSDGSYSASVSSGGTLNLPDITVTDSDGSTYTQPSVVNVVCSLGSGGTVNVNNVFFDNVTSGETLNIEVRQSSGSTLIGSKQGQYFRIPDSVITLDNTDGTTLSTTDVLATDALNLTAPDATAVIKNTLNAVLRSELIASNVSEDIIIGDATININQSDGTLISSVTVTAEGSGVYNVSDSTVNVLNSLGTVLSSSSVKATDTTNVSAPDANVENSDGSYSNTVASNGTLVLPDITVTDSDGSTSSFPSVKNVVCTPAADANVENSDGSYSDTVASGDTLVLPDISITINGEAQADQPSAKNLALTYTAATPYEFHFTADDVVESGGSVSQLNDQSSNGNNATQSNGTYQPSYTASDASYNSQPTITLNGDWFNFDVNVPVNIYSGFHLWWVGNVGAGGICDILGTLSNTFVIELVNNVLRYRSEFSSGQRLFISGSNFNQPSVWTMRSDGTTLYLYKDGSLNASGTWTNESSLFFTMLFNKSTQYRSQGTFADIRLKNENASLSTLNTIGSALATKYGFTWNTIT